MRTLLTFLVVLSGTFLTAGESDSTARNVMQEIRYLAPEASEVYLIWGINNWNIPDASVRPEGSFIKDKLLYTPMKHKGTGFSAVLSLQENTMVDYVFWITQGPAGKAVDVWDTNKSPQKDYHSLAANTNTVLITSKANARPKEALSILDFAGPLLSFSATIFFFFMVIRSYRFGNLPIYAGPVKVIVATAIVLSAALALIRSSVTGQCWDLYLHPLRSYPKVLWASFYDVVYVLILTVFFLLLLRIFRKKEKIRSWIGWLFVTASFSSLIAGILNVQVVQTIGKPFNYPWLYYSDFLKSADSHSAITANISFAQLIQILMVCMAAVFLTLTIITITDLLLQKLRMRGTLISTVVCCSAIYVTVAPDVIRHYDWEYDKLANPVVAFTGSLSPFSGDPQLFTMNIEDSLKFDLFIKKHPGLASEKIPGIRNVIIFVMESTPAEYIQPYSTTYRITPELEKHLPESIVFENVYAHAPATNNSMVSILGSVYPWLSYNSITKEHPDVAIPTISSELKKHGYRTAFFNSADNRFQKAGEFLGNRKFDEIKDCNTLECSKSFEVKDEKWDYLDGKDDACTAEDLSSWIKQDGEKPFFAMMWTYQTHYPYFVSGEEQTYSNDPVFNRYLNAVHHSDIALGKMLEELKQDGLDKSTLVVVVGDHGEAFGRHQQTTHASGIYEENLHVPCILINPAFKGTHSKGTGGLIDIAPTIAGLLGYEAPVEWQGRSLLKAKENDRVYFFTPWADYLFGYREGNHKYIFNATKNLTEMYDLEKDPQETINLASLFPGKAAVSRQRIAGWVQSMNTYMDTLLTAKK